MPLWRETLVGIAMSHIETLECSSVLHGDTTVRTNLVDALGEIVAFQPWYFRWGIKTYALCLGVLCHMMKRQALSALSMTDRHVFLRRVRSLPLFGLLETFAQSAAFLNVFDHPALAQRWPSSQV